MNVNIAVDDFLDGEEHRSETDLIKEIRQAYAFWKYTNSEISLGRCAELMGISIEEAKQFIHQAGYPTDTLLAPEIEQKIDEGTKKVAQRLGINW